jgi:hypothetical protein
MDIPTTALIKANRDSNAWRGLHRLGGLGIWLDV